MKICKECIQPDTRPGIFFDEFGVCGACLWEKEKKNIDWEERNQQLIEIVEWSKKKSESSYDCVIGVSGGKDSTKQAIVARDLGLRCLLVNAEPEGITEIGKKNIENLKNLGFDVISLRPNPKIMKELVKRDFYKYLNPQRVTEHSLYSSAYIIADNFNIPLIIQGENAGLTLGTSLTGLGKGSDAMKINQSNTLSNSWKDYTNDKISEKDLFMYYYKSHSLENKETRAIWLQYFDKDWSYSKNAEFSKRFGFVGRANNFDPNSIGTYVEFAQLDSDLIQVNQMLKYVKFGFGQCMDHACYDIREGRISRKEGIDLVRKYDGKCSEFYIEKFCDYIDTNIDEFWHTVEKFRGEMWKKDNNQNWYNTYWDYIKN